jgi:2-methylcitrate dehydratase
MQGQKLGNLCKSMSFHTTLSRDSNQALGLGQFAIDFLAGRLGSGPSQSVLNRAKLFHADAFLCGASALALKTNAPTILRAEALEYLDEAGASVFGSPARVKTEKAILANSSAVREWDSNGTNFGFNPTLGHTAGEFGHNDFYPVVLAACQQRGLDGAAAVRAMVLLDEIRGRLAEVFSLKTYKLDHVVHGAIGSAATYGALMGANAEQIESAIGMFVAHYIPWRAIRAGKQLSDSKGASAAISTEAAILCVKRAMHGFIGPKDIFRNPESVCRFFEPTTAGTDRWSEHGDSPFDLVLAHSGDDFAVMGMHFKLGLYEHQSAGALQGIIDLVAAHPSLLESGGSRIARIDIVAYEPAFGIIGSPMKKDPKTRQSADHSMAYIVATLLRKAIEHGPLPQGGGSNDAVWKGLMLDPYDYQVAESAIFNPTTRSLMQKIEFRHGGAEYDARYPDGIPTSLVITDTDGKVYDSGFVMYPAGHARNTTADLHDILAHKFHLLGRLSLPEGGDVAGLIAKLDRLDQLSSAELATLYDFQIADRGGYE